MNINLDPLLGFDCKTSMSNTTLKIVGYFLCPVAHRPYVVTLGDNGQVSVRLLIDIKIIVPSEDTETFH